MKASGSRVSVGEDIYYIIVLGTEEDGLDGALGKRVGIFREVPEYGSLSSSETSGCQWRSDECGWKRTVTA